jgi:ABC-type lipopolysaccharide export system ATPase subunit
MQTDLDKMTVDPKGWIIALAAHLVHDNGMQVIEHAPWLRTNYRSHTGDLDVSAAYPTNEEVMNISMETTHRELCEIEGISEDVKRKEGINLSGGHTNAIEIATELYGLPTLDVLLAAFEEHLATGA